MISRTVGFIGAGVMGEALLKGMLDAGVADAAQLYAADASEIRREAVAALIGDHALCDNRTLASKCSVVVLVLKPHLTAAVAREIAPAMTADHLVVVIAAGVTLATLCEALGTERVARVMPNTPARVGAGASAYCTGPGVTDDDCALIEQMLGAVGVCVRVEERHMDAVTGLSGSGPAYVYLAIEALSDGGVKMGLPREVSTRLAAQTVLGAAKMVLETGLHPGQLKDQVTTPGGTTIEGLHALESAGLRRAFIDAVVAATEKSRGLAKGHG